MPVRVRARSRPSRWQPGDTICARATPPGTAGVAVVRVSGPDTFRVVDSLMATSATKRQRSHTCRLGWMTDGRGRRIDRVLLTVFRRPHSYTGEDMVEISCHGGAVAADLVLRSLMARGCRSAGPGEFTRRAVIAGKMSVSQAEAVLDLTSTRAEAGYQSALYRYQGKLAGAVKDLGSRLAIVLAEVEYLLGFDEGENAGGAEVLRKLAAARRALDRTIRRAEQNRYLTDGAVVVIIGRPNVGKSSLFNRLLGDDRAIVASGPGTTRDRIEAQLAVRGVPVTFVDTAGVQPGRCSRLVRATEEQTSRAIDAADLVLAVFDCSRLAHRSDRDILRKTAPRPVLLVLNKVDLPRRFDSSIFDGHKAIGISCRTGENVGGLRTAIARRLRPGCGSDVSVSRRQLDALRDCHAALLRGLCATTLDTAALAIRAALDILNQVDPKVATDDILDRVFAGFCVGK